MTLPMSLRTAAGEQAYQDAKANKTTKPLELVPSIKLFDHWRIIENDYPYDVGYKRCHMLIVKRAGVGAWNELNTYELSELDRIKREYLYDEYDQIIENCPNRRSVSHIFHLHLVNFYDSRQDMAL